MAMLDVEEIQDVTPAATTNDTAAVAVVVPQLTPREKQQQEQKERTLFCINIDSRTTEEILYELFLQVKKKHSFHSLSFLILILIIILYKAGPIDNVVRKPDKKGNIFCLITFKYVDSCDYAIKLFNGINIYGKSLKVQQSVPNGSAPPPPPHSLQTQTSVNHYQQHQNNRSSSHRHHSLDPAGRMGGSLMQQPPMSLPQPQMMMNMNFNAFNPYPDLDNFRDNNNGNSNGGHQSRRNANSNNR